jgi:DNA-binding transcriptional LysR family regulator
MSNPNVSLDQWLILDAVVEKGSFQAAADALLKSQSSVSYSIRQLQQNLGVEVFQHKGRRAELTRAGEQILRRAKVLLEQAKSLESTARDLASGWEPEVTLAVDAIFPDQVLMRVLDRFAQVGRGTRLEIITTVLSGTEDVILQRQADIAISSTRPIGFIGENLVDVEFSCVASPDHILSQTGEVTEQDLMQQRQIVVRDSGSRRRSDAGWLRAEQRWTVSSFSQSINIITQGLGFGFIPTHMIQEELESNLLKLVAFDYGQIRSVPIFLIIADKYSSGPATSALADEIRRVAQTKSQT